MKDLEFGIPEGYVQDKTKTTSEKLVFTYVKKCSDINIMERLKSFDDAVEICEELGIDISDIIFNSTDTKDEKYYKELKIISMAANKGWKPDWANTNQKKWYSHFNCSPVFAFSITLYDYVFADAYYGGSRLCCGEQKIAEYIGKQFTKKYKYYLVLED